MSETYKRELYRREFTSSPFCSAKFGQYVNYPWLDIGYTGGNIGKGSNAPAFGFIGIDLNYHGYDGVHLPFQDRMFQTIHASHVLEHIVDRKTALQEWMRCLAVNGHLIITVPHQFLYEKKPDLPSRFNKAHVVFYTCASFLAEIETAFKPNTYRIIYYHDNNWHFNYSSEPKSHSTGSYEIECVIQKINPPTWELE